MGTSGSGSCTKEVCVLCLEGGCSCCGVRLEHPAAEVHDGCNCPPSQGEVESILTEDMTRFGAAYRRLARGQADKGTCPQTTQDAIADSGGHGAGR